MQATDPICGSKIPKRSKNVRNGFGSVWLLRKCCQVGLNLVFYASRHRLDLTFCQVRAVKRFLSEEYFPGNSRFRLRLLDADGEVSSAALSDDVA